MTKLNKNNESSNSFKESYAQELKYLEGLQQPVQKQNDTVKNEINPFPYWVFPKDIQIIIKATNEDLGFPLDFISGGIIYAVSVAIGNTHRIEIKTGFQESALVYITFVAPPGCIKSPPLTFVLQPILDKDRESYKCYKLECIEFNSTINLNKNNKEHLANLDMKKPSWRRSLVSDITPEAIAQVLEFNPKGIGLYADELAAWFKNLNRYSNGSSVELWLSTWSGKQINVDRKSNEAILIAHPFISVIGTIQNGILNQLASDERAHNGFMDRILFAMPTLSKKAVWSDSEIDSEIIEKWTFTLNKLLDLDLEYNEKGNPYPQILKLSPKAKTLLFEWQKKNAKECDNAESEAIAGAYSKMDMYAARLSLILELMFYACNESDKQNISSKSVQGAIELVEYFKKTANKVHSIIDNSDPLLNLTNNKQNIYDLLPDRFTTDEGLAVAKKAEMPERTFKRFLNNRELFSRMNRGEYEKKI